jgi:hypothetical protein
LTFLRRAEKAFSARLIHAITSSTLVMSAVADVVVEFAFDLVAVIRGEMDEQTLLRNLGVNTCGVIGSLAGVGMALAVSRRAPWWATIVLMLVFMWIGGTFGRRAGRCLFGKESNERQAPMRA